MTKAILSVGAVLAAVVALAGCGGGGSSASGTVKTPATTTSGVAGVSTSKTSTTVTAQTGSSFSAKANGLSARIRKSVRQFENGHFGAAASTGAALIASCKPTVNKQLAPHAMNSMQKKAVNDLRAACTDLHNADKQGMNGNMTAAKNWAMQAYTHAKAAANELR